MFDSGDLFYKSTTVTESRRAWTKARAELIVDTYNTIGCHGFNVGDRDLAAGRELLTALAGRAKYPFLSANLLDPTTEQPIFAPHRLIEVNGTKLGVIGLLTQRTRIAEDAASQWKVGDPVAAATAAVAALNQQGARLIILLSQLTPEETTAVLAAAPDIDLVLGSQMAKRATDLESVGGRLQALSQNRGKNIGVVTLHLQGSGTTLVQRDATGALKREIATVDGRIRRYEAQWKRALSGPNPLPQRTAYYPRSIERLVHQRGELVTKAAALRRVDPTASFASFELVPMSRTLTPNEALQARITSWKAANPEPRAARPGHAGATRILRPQTHRRTVPSGPALKKGALRDAAHRAPARLRPASPTP